MTKNNKTGMTNKASEVLTGEQELQLESEASGSFVLRNLATAMYTTDAEGRITSYNEAAARLWGRDPEIGKDMWGGSWKIYKPDGSPLPLDQCPMAIALKEKRAILGEEIIIMRPDGTKLNVNVYPQPILNDSGNLIGAVNLLIDITDQRRAERALVENEKKSRKLATALGKKMEKNINESRHTIEYLKDSADRFHRMIEEVEDYAILLLDENGTIQNWNKGVQKIKGYSEAEIVGKHFRIFYPPEDQARKLPEKLIEEAAQNGKALHEGWRVKKDGSTFWGSVVITAIHDDRQKLLGFSKVTRDLTERKMAYDKLNQYAADLEFRNKELEQFTYAASHDMKEPLRKIRFYNNFLFETLGTQLPEKEKEFLMRSISAASRMQDLIDDLLAYSKTSMDLSGFEQVDLNEVLSDVLSFHFNTIEETDAVIEAGELPIIRGVAFQCGQLFDNLIGNAIKFRHPTRTPVIRISAEKVNGIPTNSDDSEQRNFHKISIADNGIGFDRNNSEKIFEVFQRLHNRADYPGTGIGLAICKKIVQTHQGVISASGEPGKGATFTLYFPQD